MYIYTIQASDVGRYTIEDRYGKIRWLSGYFGPFQAQDIDKRLYVFDGVVQMENNAQRDKRLGKE